MTFAVDVESDATSIHRATSTRDGLTAFWTPDCDAEPRVGSIARFGFAGAPVDLRMRVDELVDGRMVRWTCLGDFAHWADTVVRWELSPATDVTGTTVLFSHEGWPAAMPALEHAKVAYVWARIVGALKGYAESGMPQPFLT
jgi:hypothetical protein